MPHLSGRLRFDNEIRICKTADATQLLFVESLKVMFCSNIMLRSNNVVSIHFFAFCQLPICRSYLMTENVLLERLIETIAAAAQI